MLLLSKYKLDQITILTTRFHTYALTWQRITNDTTHSRYETKGFRLELKFRRSQLIILLIYWRFFREPMALQAFFSYSIFYILSYLNKDSFAGE